MKTSSGGNNMLLNAKYRILVILMALTLIQLLPEMVQGSEKPQEMPTDKEGGTVVFYEGFEMGLPQGWVQQYLNVVDGFPAIWNVRTGAGLVDGYNWGDPDSAAVGDKNLVFQFQGYGHLTRLILPPIDLEFIVNPVLNFYHAQAEWQPDEFDRLTIYYRKGETGNWQYLSTFDQLTPTWTQRSIPLSDHESSEYYFALEGLNNYGFGICIDEFEVIETGIIAKELNNLTTDQASLNFIPTGSINNPVLKTTLRVTGNTGEMDLQSFTAQYTGTDYSDVYGARLYFTTGEFFETSQLVGEITDITSGNWTFNDLSVELPTGYSYLWLAVDVAQDASHGNVVDAVIPAGGVMVNGETFPSSVQAPFGNREILESIFYDSFDTDKGWILTGEWQRAQPRGYGGSYGTDGTNGSYGHRGASYAYVGENVLGTDITGLGEYPGNYEADIDTFAYQAISPSFNAFYYKDITLSFHRWLNAEPTDKMYIHLSTDEGSTWKTVWSNTDFNSALNWSQQTYTLPAANRQPYSRIRFAVGPTDFTNQYSGWNIDNLVITGTYVTQDAGVVQWIGPGESCGMSGSETVVVNVKNYGAEDIFEDIPIGFSLDGGETWQMDVLTGGIPFNTTVEFTFTPKANFSVPGHYNDIIVKTFWENDQDDSNDSLLHELFSIPWITPPYSEIFVETDGLWLAGGQDSSWEWNEPSGEHFTQAQAGNKAWFTNPGGIYNNNEASWIESPCFDFSSLDNPVMEFYINTHTYEGADGAAMQYSADEGHTWNDLFPLGEEFEWGWQQEILATSLQDFFGTNNGWHGDSDGWQRARAVLQPETSGIEKIRFRLVFASGDNSSQTLVREGVGFDAVALFEAPHDLGVVQFIDPVSSCELDTLQQVTVSIQNFGINTVDAGTQIPVGLEIDEYPTAYEFFTLQDALTPGQTTLYTFETPFDMSAKGLHTLKAYTMLAGDNDFFHPGIYNDTLQGQVTVFGYPEFTLGEDIYTQQPDTVVLDAGEGYVGYLWNDGSTNQTFAANMPTSAWYKATVTDENSCSTTDSVEVITRDMAIAGIAAPLSDCEITEPVNITVTITNSGPDKWAQGTAIPLEIWFENELFDITQVGLQADLNPGEQLDVEFSNPFTFDEPGEYLFSIQHTAKDAGPLNDSISDAVFIYGFPQPSLGDLIYSHQPDTLILDGGEGYSTYLWNDGSFSQLLENVNPFSQWYSVTVTDEHGCPGTDSVYILTYDIDIVELVNPVEACELTEAEPVVIKIVNNGAEPMSVGTSFPFHLELNGALLATDTLFVDEEWLAGEERELTFSATVDMSIPNTYQLKVWQAYRDAVAENDTLAQLVQVHGYPDIFLPPYITTDAPEIVVLEPGAGYASYLWHDGSTSAAYHVIDWGVHWVEVRNAFGCLSTDTTIVYPEVTDLSIDSLISPVEFCSGSESLPVRIRIFNSGYTIIPEDTPIEVQFWTIDNEPVVEIFRPVIPILPQSHRIFQFESTYTHLGNSEEQLYVSVNMVGDSIPENNTYEAQPTVFPLPELSFGGPYYTTDPLSLILSPGEGFESYLWQDGSTNPEFQVPNLHSGFYSATVTDANGCEATDSVGVFTYDLQLESVVSPHSFCELTSEENVVVDVYNSGYDTFQAGDTLRVGYLVEATGQAVTEDFKLTAAWAPNTLRQFVFEQKADLSGISETEFTAFVITADADTLNDTNATVIEITGRPQVFLGEDIYTNKPDTILLDAGSGFASYMWQDGFAEQLYPVSAYGWKWVTVTDQYGCTGSDTLYVGFFIDVQSLALEFTSKVYPNPVSGALNLEIQDLPAGDARVMIMDISGNVVLNEKIQYSAYYKKTISVDGFSAGVYLLTITSGNTRHTHRITILP